MAARPLIRFLVLIAFIPLLAAWADSGRNTGALPDPHTAPKTVRLRVGPEEDPIGAIAFSPDGRFLADAGNGGVRLWSLPGGVRVTGPKGGAGVLSRFLAFSPDGTRLVRTYDQNVIGDRAIVFLDKLADGSVRSTRTFSAPGSLGPDGGRWPIAFSPDGKTLAAGQLSYESVILWDTATGREQLHFYGGVAATFSPDGRSLISVSPFGRIHRWQAGTNRLLDSPGANPLTEIIAVQWVVFSRDRRQVALGDGHVIWVKDLETGAVRCRLEAPRELCPLEFSPDGRLLAVLNGPGISFFDTATGKEKGWACGSGYGAFSPDGRFFAWSQKDSIAIEETWRLTTGGVKSPPQFATEPAGVPLQAELIANRKTFALDLGGRTSEQFAQATMADEIDVPKLGMTVRLRNTGNRPLRVRSFQPAPGYVSASLLGPGAINFSRFRQTGISSFRNEMKPLDVSLHSGATISGYVEPLNGGNGEAVFWAAPGEYRLALSISLQVSPAPKGSEIDENGFGQVWLHCQPQTFWVQPAKELGSKPAEKPAPDERFGSLVPPPEDDATRLLHRKLTGVVNLDKGVPEGCSLKDVMEFFADRYELEWVLDEPAFRRLGKKLAEETKTDGLPPIVGARIETLLYLILGPLGADYEVRKGKLWIVPAAKPKPLTDRLPRASFRFRQRLEEPRTVKDGIPRGMLLGDSVTQLAELIETPILIDRPAFIQAGVKGIEKTPAPLPEQKDVPFLTILERLLTPRGASYVVRDRLIVVVPKSAGK